MRNSVDNKLEQEKDFTEVILQHCFDIANGQCTITFDEISTVTNDKHAQILYGLHCMNEEIITSKEEYALRVKNEYITQRLKDKNRELEQFAYKASHDLKEPIRTIFSFSQLLKTSLPNDIDPKLVSYLDYIQMSAKRMTDMISHLLNYARFGNQFEFCQFDIHSLIQGVHFDLINLIQNSKGKLILGELHDITGDETLLRLLFQNLISNAMKFRKQDLDPVVQISSENEKDFIKFSIIDNGIGIPLKDREKLFNIFARADHRDISYEGSGIGLAHCKKIVEMHQGTIWCESNALGGSSFHFTISKNLKAQDC